MHTQNYKPKKWQDGANHPSPRHQQRNVSGESPGTSNTSHPLKQWIDNESNLWCVGHRDKELGPDNKQKYDRRPTDISDITRLAQQWHRRRPGRCPFPSRRRRNGTQTSRHRRHNYHENGTMVRVDLPPIHTQSNCASKHRIGSKNEQTNQVHQHCRNRTLLTHQTNHLPSLTPSLLVHSQSRWERVWQTQSHNDRNGGTSQKSVMQMDEERVINRIT